MSDWLIVFILGTCFVLVVANVRLMLPTTSNPDYLRGCLTPLNDGKLRSLQSPSSGDNAIDAHESDQNGS